MPLTMLSSSTENTTMARRRVLLALALAILLLIAGAGCWRGEDKGDVPTPEPTIGLSSLTVEDVYSRLAEAIARPDSVFHTLVDLKVDAQGYSLSGSMEVWIDLERDVARQEIRLRPDVGALEEQRETDLVVGDASYWLTSGAAVSKRHALTCHGSGSGALSTLLGCRGFTEDSSTHVETGAEYQGQPAITLVTVGESFASDENFAFTTRLYQDEKTFLPIASVSDGTMNELPYDIFMRFDNEFVQADSPPSDFFDPVALGYPYRYPAEPLDKADLDLAIYWLGDRFVGRGDYPALILGRVYLPEGREGPDYQAVLEYWVEGSDAPGVYLEEWKVDDWTARWGDAVGDRWWNDPCTERIEKVLEEGHAMIFKSYEEWTVEASLPGAQPSATVERECPSVPFDRFRAQAELGWTVVVIDAPGFTSGRRAEQSPYDTAEGMDVLLEGLTLRR